MDTETLLIGAGLVLLGMAFGIGMSISLIHETVKAIVKVMLEEDEPED